MIFPSLAANLSWSIVVAGVTGALEGRNLSNIGQMATVRISLCYSFEISLMKVSESYI